MRTVENGKIDVKINLLNTGHKESSEGETQYTLPT